MNKIMQFFRGESGSIVPMVGLGIAAIIGGTGVAVDVGRAQLVQAKLTSSLDAAGLAAGSTVSTVNVKTEVTKYLNANFKSYLGSTVTITDPIVSNDNSKITLAASAVVPTTFMRAFGKTSMKVSATSEITRQSSGLEVVMVLDNTGSMSSSKMSSLKTAATSLVNTLYGSNSTVSNLWIGLVPFSQAVNIGSSRTSWVETDSFNWGTTSWGGCVDAREASNRDITDDPPSVAKFPKYYWVDDSDNNWISISTSTTTTYICTNNTNCRCTNYGPCTSTTVNDVTTTIACSGSGSGRDCTKKVSTPIYTYTIDSSHGPNRACPQAVTPLTASKSTILDAIDDMQARGNTHIVLGAAWGWRMLSPSWQNLWGGEMNTNGLPLAYNTPKMSKAVIIMTDGDNTIDNNNRGAYWYLGDEKLGTDDQSDAEGELDDRLEDVCTNMKNKNIIVYTVSFGTISTSSKNMLKACATQDDYYFASTDSAGLQAAFNAIGDSLSNLRVSK